MITYILLHLLPLLPYYRWVRPAIRKDGQLYDACLRELRTCSIHATSLPAAEAHTRHQRTLQVRVLAFALGMLLWYLLIALYHTAWH